MTVKELKVILSEYDNASQIDFGDRYLVKLNSTNAGMITCVWEDKAKRDAADKAKKKKEEEDERHEAATSLPLDQSGLDKRLVKILKNEGIRTIYELAQNDILDLMPIRGFGRKSINQVETELKKHGWYPGGHRAKDLEQKIPKNTKRKS